MTIFWMFWWSFVKTCCFTIIHFTYQVAYELLTTFYIWRTNIAHSTLIISIFKLFITHSIKMLVYRFKRVSKVNSNCCIINCTVYLYNISIFIFKFSFPDLPEGWARFAQQCLTKIIGVTFISQNCSSLIHFL